MLDVVCPKTSIIRSDRFPLSVSSDGRYLVDVTGTPFIIKGDTPWMIFNELSPSDVEVYLADRASRGFNSLVVQVTNPVKYVTSSVSPRSRGAGMALPFSKNTSGGAWDGDPTFAHFDADFSSPVDAYWGWVDYVIARARAYGMVMIMDTVYYGFNLGATDGWYQTIGNTANTQTVCLNFGTYLGDRWKVHQNIIFSMGTDTFPTGGSETAARIAKVQDGLIAAGCTRLTLAHYQRSSGSRDYSAFNQYITLRGTYPGAGNGGSFATNVARLRKEWDASPTLPTFAVESNYEPPRTRTQLRTLAYHGILSSPAGYNGFGNDPIWTFNSATDSIGGIGFPWQDQLGSTGSTDLHILWGLVDTLTGWHLLQPRDLGTIGTLITAGGGTLQTMGQANPTSNGNVTTDNTDGQDWIAAAATSNKALLVAYRPPAHTGSFTVDMTKMAGTTRRDWFDPTNASFTSDGSSLSNTGTHAFTPPGNNSAGASDWVLVLRSP